MSHNCAQKLILQEERKKERKKEIAINNPVYSLRKTYILTVRFNDVTMVTTNQGALNVADLELYASSNRLNDDDGSHHTGKIDDDHNSVGRYVNDDSDEDDDDDDSFLANNSICKMHKNTIQMLDSLKDEVVEMARNDTKTLRTRKRNQTEYLVSDMTIDLNNDNDNSNNDESLMHSPLNSPMNIRNINSVGRNDNASTSIPVQSFDNSKHIGNNDSDDDDDDDSTMCSIDDSINNELNALKDVALELGKELEAENLNIHTVFEAIDRIGSSDDPNVKNILVSDERDTIRNCIRDEIKRTNNNEQQQKMKNILLRCCHLGYNYDDQMFDEEQRTKSSVIILIVSIFIGFILKYISTYN